MHQAGGIRHGFPGAALLASAVTAGAGRGFHGDFGGLRNAILKL